MKIHQILKLKFFNKSFFLVSILITNVLIFILLVLILTGQLTFRINIEPFEIISDMDIQNKPNITFNSQFFDSKRKNFLPILESSPLDNSFYRYLPHEFSKVENVLKSNPVTLNDYILLRGKILFERNCVICHGESGKGDGEIVTKVILKEDEEGYPNPKDLTSKTTQKLSDGRLFHILSAGQNLMFSFNDRLNNFDKWCVIHYIRTIQNLQK